MVGRRPPDFSRCSFSTQGCITLRPWREKKNKKTKYIYNRNEKSAERLFKTHDIFNYILIIFPNTGCAHALLPLSLIYRCIRVFVFVR